MSYMLYDVNEGIATITINRTEALNAFNADMLDELYSLLDDFSAFAFGYFISKRLNIRINKTEKLRSGFCTYVGILYSFRSVNVNPFKTAAYQLHSALPPFWDNF